MASTYLTRTPSSNGNDKIATFSAWIKRGSSLGSQNNLFTSFPANERTQLFFTGDDILQIQSYSGGSATMNVKTNRKFRDTNGWYHIVIAMDSTQATASDRVKFYVNGVQETSFVVATYINQNTTLSFNTASRPFYLGTYDTSSLFFDGSMSHVHWIDGTAYDASAFGSTDSTTGEWKINTSPSVTYGTNGFFILKDGNSVTDQSGNSNNFTVGGGTLTKTEDCPDNVFATWNPLTKLHNGTYTFTNGNTTCEVNVRRGTHSTLGASSGKFYWETKLISNNNTNNNATGISAKHSTAGNDGTGEAAEEYIYKSDGQKTSNNTSSSYASTYTNGDIIGVAMDLDNNKLYFSKNGTWQNSGVPTSGSTGTGAISIIAPASTTDNFYVANAGNENDTAKWSANFGNGYFGTTAVSSAGTNASGNGIFEYDVPTGYTALSTKGLNL
nr:lectin domain containing protein [uncultured Mediterranean phage uvMED]